MTTTSPSSYDAWKTVEPPSDWDRFLEVYDPDKDGDDWETAWYEYAQGVNDGL